MSQCKIDGCEKDEVLRRGWCHMHYQRWKRHGDPEFVRPAKSCEVEGCGRTGDIVRGMCRKHYWRWKQHGDAEGGRTPDGATFLERLDSFVDRSGECWLWTGTIDRGGYGKLKINGRGEKAHRASYEAFVGEIPEGLEVDHLCFVRNCVNPEHLEAVPRAENQRRMNARRHQEATYGN